MEAEKRQIVKRIVYTAFTAVLIIFIFAQSCLPAKISSEESSRVLEFLNSITDLLGLGSIFTSHIVRKLAHFTEFAMLGVFFMLSVSTYKNKYPKQYIMTLLGCLSVAVCDECIQLFIPGRAGSIQDVLLDFSGALFGVTVVSVFIYFNKRTWNKNHRGKI